MGQLPFPASTLSQAMRFHTQQKPPEPRSLRPELPLGLEQIIMKALEKQQANRFESGRAMAEALAGVASQLTTGKRASSPGSKPGGVSLMTQIQSGVVQGRGASLLQEFPDMPSPSNQDQLIVLDPNQNSRSMILKDKFTIGRQEGNDLVIDHSKISRNHVRIEFDGVNYKVTDLNSSNGTYLGNTKLLPGVAETWPPNQPLRIGDHWLRLERKKSWGLALVSGLRSMVRQDGTMIERSLMQTSLGEQRVAAYIEQNQLTVEPGRSQVMSLVVLNQGMVVDHFKIEVEGIPANWLPTVPPPIRLLPATQQEIKLTIQPPRAPQSQAKTYPLTLRITSQDAPDQEVGVQASLTIKPYHQFSSELRPQRLQAGQPGRLTLQNQGNSPQTYTIKWQDQASGLEFQPPQVQVTVAEGQEEITEFRARPAQRRWSGGEQSHPITIQVSTPTGESQRHNGEVISRSTLPKWAMGAFMAAITILLLGGGAFFAWSRNQEQQRQQAAFQATQTAEAEAVQARATEVEIAKVEAANAVAATGTAAWRDMDDDRDGLSNQEELDIGTLPNQRDTDGDGIDDGEERKYKTLSLEADTDGDGLKDGEEVRLGTDPIEADTDKDGIRDNQDNEPLISAATQTAEAQQTQAVQTAEVQQTQAAQTAIAQEATAEARKVEASATAAAIAAEGTAQAIGATATAEYLQAQAAQANANRAAAGTAQAIEATRAAESLRATQTAEVIRRNTNNNNSGTGVSSSGNNTNVAPFTLQVGGNHQYEPWGAARGDICEARANNKFDDKVHMEGFNLELILTNNTLAQIQSSWRPVFTTNTNREVPACPYEHAYSGPPKGYSSNVTFFTLVNVGERVTRVTLTEQGYTATICLGGNGAQVGC